eukprot:CAMPEP_0204519532 /NCGR_PEP_ID=MMETSP0661-20131031/4782_1 /ASSEMBLY_ACC=CAM_ASM_000606 /TAXON_ID=109239 /ORGANISM="Alexandrium margalefi, Strain AMGDE01CS-322" /LENGTH=392 /DNA_ID=CAMNT_0051525039 /DNA_START=53 /DNA_END=1227 /DNA_ORIENTATION=-
MWIAVIIVLGIFGAVACVALRGKRSLPMKEEGPTVAPIPKGFHFFDEDAADAAGAPPEATEAEVLELPGDGPEAMGIAFLAGNPGIVHSYCSYARCMQEELAEVHGGRKATIYCVGLANFVTRRDYSGPVLGVEEETRHVARSLTRIAARHRESGLVVMAHSISSWMALRYLLEATKQGTGCLAGAKVPWVIMAMPYLEYEFWSGEQGFMRSILWRSFAPRLLKWITNFYLGLDLEGRIWVMKNFVGAETEEDVQILLATSFRQQHHYRGMLLLLADEFRVLAKGSPTSGFALMEELLREERRPEMGVYFVDKGDTWGPLKHMERLSAMFAKATSRGGPPAEVGLVGDVEHKFVLSSGYSRTVARALAPALAAAWKRVPDCRPLPSGAGGGA